MRLIYTTVLESLLYSIGIRNVDLGINSYVKYGLLEHWWVAQLQKSKNNLDQTNYLSFLCFHLAQKAGKAFIYITGFGPRIFKTELCAKWGGKYNNGG